MLNVSVKTEDTAGTILNSQNKPSTAVSTSSTSSNKKKSSWNIIKNPVNGRTRISQACDRCRSRKIKCSGKSEVNPRCTNCEKDGFQCLVSDKLTRNSFPKGYTKNLEMKLLDVELDRNKLLLELNELKSKLNIQTNHNEIPAITETGESIAAGLKFNNNYTQHNNNDNNNDNDDNNDDNVEDEMIYEMVDDSSNNDMQSLNDFDEKSIKKENATDGDLTDITPRTASEDSNTQMKPFQVNSNGLLVIDQFLRSPFQSCIDSLNLNSFNGYTNTTNQSSSTINVSAAPSVLDNRKKSVSPSSANYPNNQSSQEEEELKILANYHMNLNRYLNLILYKLIFPLVNLDENNGSSNNNANSKEQPSKDKKNLDHLIWVFFSDFNKLIPILDFELFYNDYLTFINKFTFESSTYVENGEIKKKYHEFNTKEQDLLIKLILILKFVLPTPKYTNLSSIPNKQSLNQFEESIKLINVKNLKLLFKNINFTIDLSIDKFEISLLLFHYILKFENYNVSLDSSKTTNLQYSVVFLRDVLQICLFLSKALNLNKNSNLLVFKDDLSQVSKIQRLKLYWSFKILVKLFKIYFSIELYEDDNLSSNGPKSLESIKLIHNDITITLKLISLLALIPTNFMNLLLSPSNKDELIKVDSSLNSWAADVDKLLTDENSTIINKLKTYYYYFKILIHLNNPNLLKNGNEEIESLSSSYIEIAYDIILTSTDASVNIDNLTLNSFNFHMLTMCSIISLKDSSSNSDKLLNSKILKLTEIYKSMIDYKNCNFLILSILDHLNNNLNLKLEDDPIQNDELKLFSYSLATSTSLFDRKPMSSTLMSNSNNNSTLTNNNTNTGFFDLSAFQTPADSAFGTISQPTLSGLANSSLAPATDPSNLLSNSSSTKKKNSKRHKSNSPSSPSSVFSSLSSVSRTSSLSSRRLSGSSSSEQPPCSASSVSSTNSISKNSNVPSLFASASATPKFVPPSNSHNILDAESFINGTGGLVPPSTPSSALKKRRNSLFDTFNQSINGSLNNGLRKLRNENAVLVVNPASSGSSPRLHRSSLSSSITSAANNSIQARMRSKSVSTATIDEQRELEHEAIKLQSNSRSQSECGNSINVKAPEIILSGADTGEDTGEESQLHSLAFQPNSFLDDSLFRDVSLNGFNLQDFKFSTSTAASVSGGDDDKNSTTAAPLNTTNSATTGTDQEANDEQMPDAMNAVNAAAASMFGDVDEASDSVDYNLHDFSNVYNKNKNILEVIDGVSVDSAGSGFNSDKKRTTSFRDDDDLNKLKERVLGMKSTVMN